MYPLSVHGITIDNQYEKKTYKANYAKISVYVVVHGNSNDSARVSRTHSESFYYFTEESHITQQLKNTIIFHLPRHTDK